MQDIVGYILIEKSTGYIQSMLYKTEGAAKSARTNMYGHHRGTWGLPRNERLAAQRTRAEAKADIVPVGRINQR